jgi:K+-sensing histidine kinase KdpD
MSEQDREEFFQVMAAELHYLIRLLEDLFFIADLSEPHFKTTLEQVNLSEILDHEIKIRQQNSKLQWRMITLSTPPILVMGDSHLLLRLFKNALDNAGRFAQSQVSLQAKVEGEFWEFTIADDGPGLSEKALAEFGQRRQNRIQSSANTQYLSLGLGSVIMKSIAELHRGSSEIQNHKVDGNICGARLKIRLHK